MLPVERPQPPWPYPGAAPTSSLRIFDNGPTRPVLVCPLALCCGKFKPKHDNSLAQKEETGISPYLWRFGQK